ncbi:vegetative incompatibility protein HET-E-1, putative [Rhizoctonia solani AG-3 Rhs1AP]|uniref:Vegetative incompatibility protein HET-E-1, putative n=1 Tax=Rhizoctonia solani AG-3 Rhs1AP TaxID=1086054 RepID=X8IXC7_9AGAM|nr:vegetative incompatibility protein HET-E-1, putative [Rhizoctonia solani AG-3 Rhs1AP]
MSSPSQSGSSPVPAGPEHPGNGGLAALKKSLEMLHLKTFSPIQAAVGDLASGINMMETVTRNRKDYKNVVLELEDMADTVDKYVRNAMSEQIASRMSKIVEKEIGEVKMRQAQGRTRQMLTVSENEEDIARRNRRIEALFRRVQMG